jgi:hypothetical protein
MKIAITSQDGRGDFCFSGQPWDSFKSKLEDLGHEITPLLSAPDAVIFNNFSNSLARRIPKKVPKKHKFLIVWEPPANLPQNFRSKNQQIFGKIFYPSPIWSEKFSGESFSWPQGSRRETVNRNWSQKKDKVCLIQANRWRISTGEKYSFRRQVLKACNESIDIFGRDWNRGWIIDLMKFTSALPDAIISKSFSLRSIAGIGAKFDNYWGSIENKLDVLSEYRFSLVIENSDEYVSEKIVDALIAGTIPIYVGANLEVFGFPKEIAYVCNPDVNEISLAIRELMENKNLQQHILESGRNFLSSRFFEKINNVNVLTELAREIGAELQ